MKSRVVFIVVLLLIAAGISSAVLYSRNLRKRIDATNARIEAESAEQGETGSSRTKAVAGMDIKGMSIVQGEGGRERWMLVAEKLEMSEAGGDIVAQKPYLTYYLAHEASRNAQNTLYVTSVTGDLDQQGNVMRFVDDVVATREDDVLTTSLLIYEGEKDRLHCPELSHIKSEGMNGTARELFWHLNDNTLHATGGVSLDFETSRRAGPGGIK